MNMTHPANNHRGLRMGLSVRAGVMKTESTQTGLSPNLNEAIGLQPRDWGPRVTNELREKLEGKGL